MNERQLTQLVLMLEGPRRVPRGEYLMVEDESPEEIYVVQSGSFDVLKRDDETCEVHSIGSLTPGMTAGEVSLLDRGPRSASVRANEDAEVFVLKIDELQALEDPEKEGRSLSTQLKINLAYEMGNRVRSANFNTIENLRAKLQEERIRTEMAGFIGRVLLWLCMYMFALGAALSIAAQLPNTLFVTIGVLVVFSVLLFINIRLSSLPAREFGFNLDNWQRAIKEAVLLSLPAMILMVGAKWIVVHTVPNFEGQAIFDFYQSRGVTNEVLLMSMVGYTLFSPVQEMVTRCGMQAPLLKFFTSPYAPWYAGFIAAVLYSALHLHISVQAAAFVFPLGLWISWVYHRVPSLLGPSIVHIILGVFGVFVVGFGF